MLAVPYVANEILLCLIAAALVGGVTAWLLKAAAARRQLGRLTTEHDQTLSTTEQELQRVSSELAGQNRRAAEAVAALDPLKGRVEESEAKVIATLLEKDHEVAKAKDQRAEADRLRAALAETERRTAGQLAESDQLVTRLEGHLNEAAPLIAEVSALRSDAATWERKSRQLEQYTQTQLGQHESELALLRSRLAELEPMPAKLVDRDTRLKDLENRHRSLEAAWQSRVQTLETATREAENRALDASRSLQMAEQQTARLLDERAAEIRMLKHRIAEMEPAVGRIAERDQALQAMRAQLAEREAEVIQWRTQSQHPLAMAAAAESGSVSVAPQQPASAAALTPAELQGCLQSLLFERGLQFTPKSTELEAASQRTLAEVAALLKQAPGVPVSIEGHTDNWGDPHANWQLSLWRTEAVRRYLGDLGVAESRMSCVGYGEGRPIEDNGTPEGRWKNRRTEIRVVAGT